MDLFAKFEAVEMKVDFRISEADKQFCEAHQSAYEAAKSALTELQFFWADILQTQETLLTGTSDTKTTYLSGYDTLKISPDNIQEQLKALHNIFIEKLVGYFNQLYHVTISYTDIIENLLPKKPERRSYDDESLEEYKKKKETYESDLLHLSLTHDTILEQIFAQMDGRGLWEQALYELKEKCHHAGWYTHNKSPKYELHKDVLRFVGYACNYTGRYYSSPWTLEGDIKNVLQGIAHYETGSFSYIPCSMSGLLGYSNDSDLIIFYDCKKVSQLKMFKNGRVDIKFADASHAKTFVDEYLGTVY